MPEIDDEQYQRGRCQFKNGASLRAMCEALQAAEAKEGIEESREMSFVLGFVDAAFDKLRGIER
ncbi:MAG: hypothetical protein GC182_03150 [Rhodopseudomonas sp.]|nr:hypothetical protein [Rhodopseudomonas sp.]